jgi:hypothetical protein
LANSSFSAIFAARKLTGLQHPGHTVLRVNSNTMAQPKMRSLKQTIGQLWAGKIWQLPNVATKLPCKQAHLKKVIAVGSSYSD